MERGVLFHPSQIRFANNAAQLREASALDHGTLPNTTAPFYFQYFYLLLFILCFPSFSFLIFYSIFSLSYFILLYFLITLLHLLTALSPLLIVFKIIRVLKLFSRICLILQRPPISQDRFQELSLSEIIIGNFHLVLSRHYDLVRHPCLSNLSKTITISHPPGGHCPSTDIPSHQSVIIVMTG